MGDVLVTATREADQQWSAIAVGGPFFHPTASAVSGSPWLKIQMLEDDTYFLVAGDNMCGIGPKH